MRKQLTIETAVKVAILLMIGILSSYFHARFDLTADRRYSLSKPTKQMLSRLDDEILFRVYLDGDLPAGFQRLQNSVREMLDEFRAYGGENIQYEFIDPAENPNQQGRERVFRELYEKGLDPTNLQIKEKDGSTAQKLIFPGIIVSYAGRDVAVNILKNHVSASADANLQTSIQSLEYDLTFAINQLLTPEAPVIGFLRGHGELTPELVSTDSAGRLTYRALVVAQPLSRFSDAEKFMIDQYVMAGGRVLWLIDNTTASIDSLSHGREVQAMQLDLNLDDLLFNYGVRINANLVQDMQCAVVPVNTALVGQPPQFAPAPWVFSPIITPAGNHPLTKNLDMIRIDFASSIDTVGRDASVAKSILLAASDNCRVVPLPARVDLSIISERIAPEAFTHSGLAVGVLLEGEFRSAFANRPLQVDGFSRQQFRRESEPTRMIVISDGDIIRQQFRQNGDQREPLPLGYDRYTRQTFGNKEFLLNAINYLCGFDELMESRSKEFKLRMLNRAKISEQRTTWQMLNVVVPVLIIVAFGFIFNALRKRRYQ